ncbi:nuclear factor NF-kappa-B p110 subunit-like [Arctopsyche grandis]|uniref:nuclear factor NF-kappa-B p110 subunit-like n=1 Tax=Arctopsyche grandis TaxID=121162 RepID=UPI00406D7C44
MESPEKFGDIVYDDMFEQYSFIPMGDCSFSMSPESLLSPNSMTMSPPAQQVPQEDNLPDNTIGTNMYYQNTRMTRKPYLKIIDQPTTKFRFRYKSEMSGTHGCLSGRSRKKSYPTVQLVNHSGSATISCTLVQNNERHEVHPHRLVIWKGDDEDDGPVDVDVSSDNKYIAKFQNMAILFTGKKSIAEELLKLKKKANMSSMSKDEEFKLRKMCEMEARNINLNSACLEFAAYDENKQLICEPIYSDSIDNSKSAETCQLKITNISKTSGSCNGGDTVFMFVEKVNKKNIKIKFFEVVNDVRVWEDYANFTELDVHHQFGIVFKTPAYRNLNITQDVDVYIELYRPKDRATSDEIPFRYKVMPRQSKKRRIVDDLSSTFLSSKEFSPYLLDAPNMDVPLTVTNLNHSNMHMNEYLNPNIPNPPLPPIRSQHNVVNPFKNDDSSDQNYNSFDLENFLADCTKNMNEATACIIDPQIFFSDVVKDAPSRQSQNSKKQQTNTKNECYDAARKQNIETSKIIIKKCMNIYPKKDVENLLKLNLFSKKESLDKIVTENLIKILDDGLSNGENFLHMLVTIDETDLLNAIINFMQQHKLDDNMNSVNRQGETALHRAVNFYRTAFIDLLLSGGCNPNIQDENGNTAMHLCIMNGNFECVSQLLAYNKVKTNTMPALDLDITNCDGYTPLHLAFICVSKISISQLLSAKANPEIKTKNDQRTILHLAVDRGNMDLVKFVIENTPVSVNACTLGGATALHLACVSENKNAPEICRHLLIHGANPFIKFNGTSALNMATQSANPKIAEVIKKHVQENNLDDTPIIKIEDNDFLDKKTIISVSKLLDKSGKWREVAKELGCQSMISVCEDKNSPSVILLNSIEMEQNVSVDDLYKLLLKLGIQDAAEEVKKVIFKS